MISAELTERQQLALKILEKNNGSITAAAKEMGIGRNAFKNHIARAKKKIDRGVEHGTDHVKAHVPPTWGATGVSTLVNGDGEVTAQWIKASPKDEAVQHMMEGILEAVENFKYPKIESLSTKNECKDYNSDLCTIYPLTDGHMGQYSYHAETGENWDTDIATTVHKKAICQMAAQSPNSELGVLVLMGDFVHWDGLDAVTPQNRNVLNGDTRFHRLADVVLHTLHYAIGVLKRKHNKVKVYVVEGNHDPASSVWISRHAKYMYAEDDSVEVDETAFPYYAFTWGKQFLGFHHGHLTKMAGLPAVFSSEPRYRKMYGDSTQSYLFVGHYHKSKTMGDELEGAIVEMLPTLSARSSYATRGGYVSRRASKAITYHKVDGEVSRTTVVPKEGK